MYLIRNYAESETDFASKHDFIIEIYPFWKELVQKSQITNDMVQYKTRLKMNHWLKSCGYIKFKKNMAANVIVEWGEWGIHNISIPYGCNLNITPEYTNNFIVGSTILMSSNVNCWEQKQLILSVFCEIAEDIIVLSNQWLKH